MSYSATVHQIMIASPSDVGPERQLIRDVIAAWNAVHSVEKNAVLLPVSWESHSSPEMGDRPQGIINRRLLKDCDLLIAAFWTRIGGETGVAISGTVEEIEEHLAATKEAMIYFSQAPVRLDSVDAEQYEHLRTFRSKCQTRGLYETYESLSEFREKLNRQLTITMIRRTVESPRIALEIATNDRESLLDRIAPDTGKTPVYTLLDKSSRTKELLRSMSEDRNGTLLRVDVIGGVIFQTHGRRLNVQGDARDAARWDSAIGELEGAGFIKAAGFKREIFKLTSEGYDEANRTGV